MEAVWSIEVEELAELVELAEEIAMGEARVAELEEVARFDA